MCFVLQQTYRDFHSDLYPDTTSYRTDLTAAEWLNGTNMAVPKMSLDPAKRELGDAPIVVSSCCNTIFFILFSFCGVAILGCTLVFTLDIMIILRLSKPKPKTETKCLLPSFLP